MDGMCCQTIHSDIKGGSYFPQCNQVIIFQGIQILDFKGKKCKISLHILPLFFL